LAGIIRVFPLEVLFVGTAGFKRAAASAGTGLPAMGPPPICAFRRIACLIL